MSPFGGIKDSGLGYKEGVIEAMKCFTNVKTYSPPWVPDCRPIPTAVPPSSRCTRRHHGPVERQVADVSAELLAARQLPLRRDAGIQATGRSSTRIVDRRADLAAIEAMVAPDHQREGALVRRPSLGIQPTG